MKTKLLPPHRLAEIQGNFHKYGVKILLFTRLLPGIRSPIFITAGIMLVSLMRFLVADCIYAIPGVSLLFFLGFWFTDQFLEVIQRAESLRPLIIVVVLTVVATYLVFHFMRRPVSTGAPEELPALVGQIVAKEGTGSAEAKADAPLCSDNLQDKVQASGETSETQPQDKLS